VTTDDIVTDSVRKCKNPFDFVSSDEEVEIVESPTKDAELREGSLSPEYAPQLPKSAPLLSLSLPRKPSPTAVPEDKDPDVEIIADQREGSMSPEYGPQTTLPKPPVSEPTKPDVQIVAYNDTIFIKCTSPTKPLTTAESPVSDNTTISASEATPEVAKRGRGRPKGSLGKAKRSDPDPDPEYIDSVKVSPKRGKDGQPPIKITVTRNLWADWNPTQNRASTPSTESRPVSSEPPPDIPPSIPTPHTHEVTDTVYKIVNKDSSTKKRIRTSLKPQPLSRKLTALSRLQSPELIIRPSAKSPNKMRKTGSLKQKYNKTIAALEETEEAIKKVDERGDSDYHPDSDSDHSVIEID